MPPTQTFQRLSNLFVVARQAAPIGHGQDVLVAEILQHANPVLDTATGVLASSQGAVMATLFATYRCRLGAGGRCCGNEGKDFGDHWRTMSEEGPFDAFSPKSQFSKIASLTSSFFCAIVSLERAVHAEIWHACIHDSNSSGSSGI